VLDGVGERLLDDPVGRQVDPGRQRLLGALDHQLDPEPGPPDLLDQRRHLGQAGLGGEAGGLVAVAPQHPEQPAHLDQGLAPGGRDRLEGAGRPGRFGRHRHRAGLGLHHHHADVVGDHVVQLAGDPGALGGHRPAGVLGPVPFQPRGPLLELGGQRPLHPGPVAQHPRAGQGERDEGGVDHVGVGPGQGHDNRHHHGRDRAGEQGRPPAPPGGHRVHADHAADGDRHGQVGIVGEPVDGGGQAGGEADDQRAPPAPHQRQRRGQHQDHGDAARVAVPVAVPPRVGERDPRHRGQQQGQQRVGQQRAGPQPLHLHPGGQA
jgi:hypothetical protein